MPSALRIMLQSDWHDAIGLGDTRLWLSLKENNHPTQKCELEVNADKVIRCSNPTVKARLIHPGHLRVFQSNEQTQERMSCDFFAPSKSFNTHKKSVVALDVDKDSLGVSASTDGQLLIWQSENGRMLRKLEGHVADVYCCRFFPSGCIVLSTGADMKLKIWNTENGQCVQTLSGHSRAVNDLGFVGQGRNVLSCSGDGTCKLWDCGSASCLMTFGQSDNSSPINALCDWSRSHYTFRSDQSESDASNKMISLAYENGELATYALDECKKLSSARFKCAVNCVAISNDERRILCGLEDGSVSWLDCRKLESPLKTWNDGRPAALSIVPFLDGFFISFGDGSTCYLPDEPNLHGNYTTVELTGPDIDPVYKVALSSRLIFTCCRDSRIRAYDLSLLENCIKNHDTIEA